MAVEERSELVVRQAQPMGADVEIIEPYTEMVERSNQSLHAIVTNEVKKRANIDTLPVIKPTHVRINGTDVGIVMKDSIEINVPADDITTITLTLAVRSITIKAE